MTAFFKRRRALLLIAAAVVLAACAALYLPLRAPGVVTRPGHDPAEAPAAGADLKPDCTVREGDSDKVQLDKVLLCLQYAFEHSDEKGFLQFFSEEYVGHDGMTYEWMKEHLHELLAVKKLLRPRFVTTDAVISIKGDEAQVGPLFVDMPTGKITIYYRLRKYQPGGWRVYRSAWKT